MKQVCFFLIACSFSVSSFAAQVFNSPTVVVDGVSHKIIDEDTLWDDWYDESAMGFCRLEGFEKAGLTSAIKGWEGPYAALDRDGNVIATFPHEGNLDRFYELSQITCE
ncbi:MAG: hypothetical protein CL676_02240 [Bdellovibrionaceae bacterium]|nr:hypothetical protein [Pseudobdellovibrionaceae bacterium]